MSSPTTGGPTARPDVPQHPAIEAGALVALGIACGIYMLHSLPAVLFPTGLMASVLTLLAGVLLGLAAAATALALAFNRLTHPKLGAQHGHAAEQLRPPRHSRRRRTPAAHSSGSTATVPGPTLPHAIAVGGEFSGTVYTAPASLWNRSGTMGNWPPTCDPTQGTFRAWEASVAQGTLVLRPIIPPPGAKPPSPRRGGAGGGSPVQLGKQASGAAGTSSDPASFVQLREARAGATATAAVAAALPPTKVGIPLEGCTVEVVMDGLRGRSEFIRRAPLLISHPRWNLLEGKHAFYLWADDPASKQQWVHALGWWCQDAEKLRAVEAMYGAYCQAMADRSILEYPEQVPPAGGSSSNTTTTAGSEVAAEAGGGCEAGAEGQALPIVAVGGPEQTQGRQGWKGWGTSKMQKMRRKMSRRGGGGSEDVGDPAGSPFASPSKQGGTGGSLPASATASPLPTKPAATAAELQSLESFIDAKWMQSCKVQMPPTIPEAVVRSRHGSRHGSRNGSKATSPMAVPGRPASSSPGVEAPHSSSLGSSSGLGMGGSLPRTQGAMLGGDGFVTPSLGTSPAVTGGLGMAASLAQGWPEDMRNAGTSPVPLNSAAATAPLPPGSPLGRLQPLEQHAQVVVEVEPQQQQQQQQQAPAQQDSSEEPTSAVPPAAGAAGGVEAAMEGQVALPPGLPQLISPDYAINAFITRFAFDLLRRPDFQETVRARIQRQLSRLQRPEYIQSLEVVGVDCGGVAPTLRNWRALPQPSAAIWPQVIFDMRYQGSFTFTIEMKVDIRDAAAWGRLDQALTRLAEGKQQRGGGGSGSASSSHQGTTTVTGTPLHAASVPALGAGSGDEEGEELEPMSPDSSAAPGDAGSQESGGHGGGRGFMGGIRHQAAKKLRQLAESTAAHISRIPLRLSLTFSLLEGTMCAWLPPPPGNRLFYAFVTPPHLELTARPELAGRFLKYSYHIARVSSWIEQRMRAAITKNIVFPGGGDIPLEQLMGLDHPNTADSLPALGHYMQQMAAMAGVAPAAPTQQRYQQPSPPLQQQQTVPAGAEVAEHGMEAVVAAMGSPASSNAVPCAEATKAEQEQPQQPPQAAPAPAPARDAAAVAVVPLTLAPAEHLSAEAAPATMPAPAPGASFEEGGQRSTGGSSSQHGELAMEPSLSLPSSHPSAAAKVVTEASAPRGTAASASDSGSEGHLVSSLYDRAPATRQPGEPPSPDFQLQSPAAAVAEAHRQPSAAYAFDAALAQEGAIEAPTPKFASQPWQQQEVQQRPVALGPLGSGLGQPLALKHQPPQQQGSQAVAESQPPVRRPSLHLHLSATRSLDPDFITSAEHTRFGEAPATALPNYGSSVRRTLSARVDGTSASGTNTPNPGRGVGESLSRSLAYLRRQSSLQHHQHEVGEQQETSMHAGLQQASPPHPPEQSSAQQHQQASLQQHQQASPQQPQQRSNPEQQWSPPDASSGDARRLRQQGGIKEQAGKFFKQAKSNMNAAGKALASQVQHMQQQRAEQRAAAPLANGALSRSSSSSRSAATSPMTSPGHSEQQQVFPT